MNTLNDACTGMLCCTPLRMLSSVSREKMFFSEAFTELVILPE